MTQRFGFSANRAIHEYVRDNADRLFICATAPASYSAASNQPQKIVSANVTANDWTISSGAAGSKLTFGQRTLAVEGSGSASHAIWARSSGSTILLVSDVCGFTTMASGNVATFPLWSTEVAAGKVTLDLFFAAVSAGLPSNVSFSRSSNGTYYNSLGTLTSAKTNVARFDYDPATLSPKGLLVERSVTQLCRKTHSLSASSIDETTQGGWIFQRSSKTVSAATAPDGSGSGFKLVENNAAGLHYTLQEFVDPPTNGDPYTASIYAKAAERKYMTIEIFSSTAGFPQTRQTFALSGNGTLAAYSLGSPANPQIQSVGNGWYRCSMTASANAGTGQGYVAYMIAPSANVAPSYTGDNSSGIYIWGPQVENAAYATSFMPNNSTTTTARAADNVAITTAAFTAIFNQTTGTIAAEAQFINASAAIRDVVSIDNGATAESYELRVSNKDGQVSFVVTDGDVVQCAVATARVTVAGVKLAAAYAVNDFELTYVSASITDTAGTLPTPTQMQLGSNPGGVKLDGWLRRVRYWNTRLTGAAMKANLN